MKFKFSANGYVLEAAKKAAQNSGVSAGNLASKAFAGSYLGISVSNIVSTVNTASALFRSFEASGSRADNNAFDMVRENMQRAAHSAPLSGSSFSGATNISDRTEKKLHKFESSDRYGERQYSSFIKSIENDIKSEARDALKSSSSSTKTIIERAFKDKQFDHLLGRIKTGQIDVDAVIASGSFNGVPITPQMAQSLRDLKVLSDTGIVVAEGQNKLLSDIGHKSSITTLDLDSRKVVGGRVKEFSTALEKYTGVAGLEKMSVDELKKLQSKVLKGKAGTVWDNKAKAALGELIKLKERARTLKNVASKIGTHLNTTSLMVQKLCRDSDLSRGIGELKSSYGTAKFAVKVETKVVRFTIKHAMKSRLFNNRVSKFLFKHAKAGVQKAMAFNMKHINVITKKVGAIKSRITNATKTAAKKTATAAKTVVTKMAPGLTARISKIAGKVKTSVARRSTTRTAKKAGKKLAKSAGKKMGRIAGKLSGAMKALGGLKKKLGMFAIKAILIVCCVSVVCTVFASIFGFIAESALSLDDTLFGKAVEWLADLHWPWTVTDEDIDSVLENTIKGLAGTEKEMTSEKAREIYDKNYYYYRIAGASDPIQMASDAFNPSVSEWTFIRPETEESHNYIDTPLGTDLIRSKLRATDDGLNHHDYTYFYQGGASANSYYYANGTRVPINQFSQVKLIISMAHTFTYPIDDGQDLEGFGQYCNAMMHVLWSCTTSMIMRSCEEGDFTITYSCAENSTFANKMLSADANVIYANEATVFENSYVANSGYDNILCVVDWDDRMDTLFPTDGTNESGSPNYGCIRSYHRNGKEYKAVYEAGEYVEQAPISSSNTTTLQNYLGITWDVVNSSEENFYFYDALLVTDGPAYIGSYLLNPTICNECIENNRYSLPADISTATEDDIDQIASETYVCTVDEVASNLCTNEGVEYCHGLCTEFTHACPGHRVCKGHMGGREESGCAGHYSCEGHTIKCCKGHDAYSVQYTLKSDVNNPDELFLDYTYVGIDEGWLWDDRVTFHTAADSPDGDDEEVDDEVYLKTKVGFDGWTDSAKDIMWGMYDSDWYTKYGIKAEMFVGGALSFGEMMKLFEKLDITLSNTEAWRYNLAQFSLLSVGNVPLYPSAEPPTAPGYDSFGQKTDIAIDEYGVAHGTTGVDPMYYAYWAHFSCNGTEIANGIYSYEEPLSVMDFCAGLTSGVSITDSTKVGTPVRMTDSTTGETKTGIFIGINPNKTSKCYIVSFDGSWTSLLYENNSDWVAMNGYPPVTGLYE